MTAPAYTLAAQFVAEYDASSTERRSTLDRCHKDRYRLSKELVSVFDAADRRCPRPGDEMSERHRESVVDRAMRGAGKARQAAE